MSTFYVNTSNNTSADTLLALGWADLLDEVCTQLGMPGTTIFIQRKGGLYKVTLSAELRAEQLTSDQHIPLLDPLKSAKQDERQAKKGRTLQDSFDYERERAKQRLRAEQRKQLAPYLRAPEAVLRHEQELARMLENAPQPRPELEHYQAINVLKVADTFNDLVLNWQSLSASQQWQAICLLFTLFSQEENNITAAHKAWDKLAKEQGITFKSTVTAVQVINPTTGKGSNTPKGNRLTSGGLDSFWLLELLKFKGFMLGAAPYMLRGSKDRKTYVLQPTGVALHTLKHMMQQFRQICWSSTAVKQDVLAILRLAQVLVEHRRTELTSRQGLEEWEPGPLVSTASGFDVTFYKDMGSAHATMNVSTINIPTWLPPIRTLKDTEAVDALLEEHVYIIRRIEGYQGKEGNDEFELLRIYRDFLSGHDLLPFWKFATLYGCYLFRQRDHEKDVRRWLPQLTKKGLDFLVMLQQKQHLTAIINNSGFQHIASAIREATVRAQRRRSQENDTTYEVRYGLGQELIRKARYRDEFMKALSEFLFLYNAETAREEEKLANKLKRRLEAKDYRDHKLRYPVTTADIEQLTHLLDDYPTELVATMLISYGYARLEARQAEEAGTEIAEPELETVATEEV
jgi:hypothetical protein